MPGRSRRAPISNGPRRVPAASDIAAPGYQLPGAGSNHQSVTIVRRLIRTVDWYADVLRLVRGELRQLHAEMVEVKTCNFLIQGLRKHRHRLAVIVGVRM